MATRRERVVDEARYDVLDFMWARRSWNAWRGITEPAVDACFGERASLIPLADALTMTAYALHTRHGRRPV